MAVPYVIKSLPMTICVLFLHVNENKVHFKIFHIVTVKDQQINYALPYCGSPFDVYIACLVCLQLHGRAATRLYTYKSM